MTAPQPITAFLTPELRKAFVDTARLVAWALQTKIAYDRLDLVPIYYPVFSLQVYAASRCVVSLHENPDAFDAVPDVRDAMILLEKVLKTHGTQQLLSDRKKVKTGELMWHSALGSADKFFFNLIRFSHADDVLWSTATGENFSDFSSVYSHSFSFP